ncbi:MAG: hypothetical protein J6R67_03705 [Treponema sp.]|nr:hypothetical protein [Treponema sp.]
MTNKKMTKAQMFAQIKANYPLTDEEVAFIDHELDLLARKNAGEKRQTPTQIANEGIKDAILDGMEDNRLYTITEIIKEIPECADMTNQRVSALVRQLKDEGKVERIEEKRKAYFRKVA